MKFHVFACLVAFALFAGCSGEEPDDVQTSGPATASESPSAPPTADEPVNPSPTGNSPVAKSVDTAPFLRSGTEKVAVIYGDMNGVAPEEIVLHSRSTQPGKNGLGAQEFVDAFAWNPGQAEWVKVFDATTFEDLPSGGGPVLVTDGSISQAVFGPFEMVDFAGDQSPELVVAVQSSGATAGPLDVWVFSWLSEGFTAEFKASTERGGTLAVNADRTLALDAPEYGPNDPGCCPSGRSIKTIGYDPADSKIKVLKTVQAQP